MCVIYTHKFCCENSDRQLKISHYSLYSYLLPKFTSALMCFCSARHYIRGWLGWQIHMDHQKNGKDEQNAT